MRSTKGKWLCCDKLDDKVYEELVAGGREDYYKSRIEECALALTEMKRINEKKAMWLDAAYLAFGIFLVVPILLLVFGRP